MRNLLLITTEGLRADHLGAAGHPVLRTPNLDRLAADGTIFLNHYAGSAPAGPSQASLLTGLYQMTHRVCRNGTPLNARFDNLSLAFERAGYRPAFFGHSNFAADPRGLDHMDPLLETPQGLAPGFAPVMHLNADRTRWFDWLRERGHLVPEDPQDIFLPATGKPGPANDTPSVYLASETETAYLTEHVIDWLPQADPEGWFAHVSYARPGPPFIAPAPYNAMYRPQDMPAPIRKSSKKKDTRHPFLSYLRDRERRNVYLQGVDGFARDWSSDDFLHLRARYCGMVSEVDAQIGRLLDALRQFGVWDDTCIVFTSDQGAPLGDHGLMTGGGYYESAYRIPLIVRDPTRPGGRNVRIDQLTEAVDVTPTLLETFNLEPANPLDGHSLAPLLDRQAPSDWRKEVHFEYDFREIASREAQLYFGLPEGDCSLAILRDANFKYVYFTNLPPLLFDLQEDPEEVRNVARLKRYGATRAAYAEKMLTWRSRNLDRTLTGIEITPFGPVGYKNSLF